MPARCPRLCQDRTGLRGVESGNQGTRGVRDTSSFSDEPWLFNLKGEVFLYKNPPDPAEAELAFRKAIELSQQMGAKSPELRASLNLARLLAKQRHRKEARATLSDIYNWFSEGLDTTDLKDARS